MHTNVKIVEGRNFEFGKNEIIAGRAAARQFVGLTVGTTLKWGESTWTLVGIFEDGGCGLRVGALVRRQGAAAGLSPRQQLPVGLRAAGVARLVPAAEGLADVQPAADGHGRCGRRDYYGSQTADAAADHPDHRRHHRRPDGHRRGVRRGDHDVHAPWPAARAKSRRSARSASAACRSCFRCWSKRRLLSIVGGLIGGAIAWLAFDGYETATMNFQSFSQIAFAFAVTPRCC